ncbi:hypothetical protein AAIH64_36385, partial [Pseudomonas aeruginosa]|uniref:hypothetical protein n=1 Tax=Pseudomonas aeruginosa TaxID=287 RepID=UPI0031B6D35A
EFHFARLAILHLGVLLAIDFDSLQFHLVFLRPSGHCDGPSGPEGAPLHPKRRHKKAPDVAGAYTNW